MTISAWAASGAPPPKLPEWAWLASVSTVTFTWAPPRREVFSVGTPAAMLPVSAIRMASASKTSGLSSMSLPSPSSPPSSSEPSTTTFRPRSVPPFSSIRRSASRCMARLPLQSAAPRPYQRPSRSVSSNGLLVQASGLFAGTTS